MGSALTSQEWVVASPSEAEAEDDDGGGPDVGGEVEGVCLQGLAGVFVGHTFEGFFANRQKS